MDAAAQLALMAKAKLVFETPGSFLSFPALAPLSFHPAQLDFSRALSDSAAMAALRDFSLAVNRCPNDPIARAGEDDYLWDRYDAWLNAMELASNSNDADNQAYAAARALLVVAGPGGVETDSPAVVAYKQWRDAVFDATQAYKAAQLSAAAGSADALNAWKTEQEPKLRGAIDAANDNWIALGHKADVEAARATLQQWEAHSPSATWSAWRAGYTSPRTNAASIDCITDPKDNYTFPPSGFAPSDLANQAWTTLHLSAAEIATLVAGAPQELRALFGQTGTSNITAISFDFRSAAVVRPWFSPAMFAARFWKFGDATQLSDGATPAVGEWPAYVTAVVFVRNVQVTYAQVPAHPLPAGELLRLAVTAPPRRVVFNPAVLQASQSVLARTVAAPTSTPISAKPLAAKAVFGAAHVLPVAAISTTATVSTASAVAHGVTMSPLLRLDAAGYRIPIDRIPIVVKPGPPVAPPAPIPAPAPTPAPTPPPPPDDSIGVLAFICSALPKSPNPDPAFTWTS
jgi:hypothetical protein